MKSKWFIHSFDSFTQSTHVFRSSTSWTLTRGGWNSNYFLSGEFSFFFYENIGQLSCYHGNKSYTLKSIKCYSAAVWSWSLEWELLVVTEESVCNLIQFYPLDSSGIFKWTGLIFSNVDKIWVWERHTKKFIFHPKSMFCSVYSNF